MLAPNTHRIRQIIAIISDHLLPPLRNIKCAANQIPVPHNIPIAFDGELQAFFEDSEFFFDVLLLGNIHPEPKRMSFRIHPRSRDREPHGCAIPMPKRHFKSCHFSGTECLTNTAGETAIVFIGTIEYAGRLPQQIPFGVPQKMLGIWTDGHNTSLGIGDQKGNMMACKHAVCGKRSISIHRVLLLQICSAGDMIQKK